MHVVDAATLDQDAEGGERVPGEGAILRRGACSARQAVVSTPSTTALSVERIETAGALAAIGPEWSTLADAHGNGLPFHTFEWVEAWWHCYAARIPTVSDSLFVRAFRDPEGRLVGVAPLILVRRPGIGPSLVRSLEFIGADPYVTEVRGPLVDPAWEAPFYQALTRELAAEARQWDRIHWRGVPDGGAGQQVLSGEAGLHLDGELTGYRLELPATWEAFKSSRPRNIKESLRRCYNSLLRDGLTAQLTVRRTPEEVAAGLDLFLKLHEARASAEELKAHGNVFGDGASRRFLAEVCARLARRDGVRLFFLEIQGQVVATRLAFSQADTLYLYFSGYDPAWSRYSVMTTTVAETIKYAIEAGYRWVHLSTGTDVSKTRWRPEQQLWRSGIQGSPTWRGRIVAGLARQVDQFPDGVAASVVRILLGRRR